MSTPKLIVMLTHNDRTVSNAAEIFNSCKNSKAEIFGFKEEGIPFAEMKTLFETMKNCGKITALEVVAYNEKECLDAAEKAVECQCNFLMGTKFFDSVNNFCRKNNLKYMPFVGEITGRPSVLEGTLEGMIDEAQECLSKGVFGIDLLGYRYTGDAVALNKNFVAQINAPVCIAGSVNSYQRLDEVKAANSWAFTIGGAFFENKFGEDFSAQIDIVCNYMEKNFLI